VSFDIEGVRVPRSKKDEVKAVESGARARSGNAEVAPAIVLDEIDLKLLGFLLEDARLSQRAMARAIGMSPPAIADRVARLEASGVIKGYHADLNYAALNRPMTVLVGVVTDRSDTQRSLADRLVEVPEVERVDIVTGSSDLQVRLRVRDQTHLSEVLFESLLATPDIRHTETFLALATVEPDTFGGRLLQSLSDDLARRSATNED
jgi:Lrp/AsnC family leucine-responsive transcriptional regulator